MKKQRRHLTRELLRPSLEHASSLGPREHQAIAQDALRLAIKTAEAYLEWSASLCDEEELPLFILEPRRTA